MPVSASATRSPASTTRISTSTSSSPTPRNLRLIRTRSSSPRSTRTSSARSTRRDGGAGLQARLLYAQGPSPLHSARVVVCGACSLSRLLPHVRRGGLRLAPDLRAAARARPRTADRRRPCRSCCDAATSRARSPRRVRIVARPRAPLATGASEPRWTVPTRPGRRRRGAGARGLEQRSLTRIELNAPFAHQHLLLGRSARPGTRRRTRPCLRAQQRHLPGSTSTVAGSAAPRPLSPASPRPGRRDRTAPRRWPSARARGHRPAQPESRGRPDGGPMTGQPDNLRSAR